MEKRTILEVLAAFNCEKPQYLSNMDQSNPSVQKAKVIEDLFTGGVHILRSIDNSVISGLMSYVWDIFHHRHILMAVGPNVPALSFALSLKSGGMTQALVLAPHNWPDMVKEDSLMQLGALIFNGSKCADFYNGILRGPVDIESCVARAQSYEAEFLKILEGLPLNEYQKEVLAKYPNGFDPILGYVRKPVIATN